jgi:hypothetical protein
MDKTPDDVTTTSEIRTAIYIIVRALYSHLPKLKRAEVLKQFDEVLSKTALSEGLSKKRVREIAYSFLDEKIPS